MGKRKLKRKRKKSKIYGKKKKPKIYGIYLLKNTKNEHNYLGYTKDFCKRLDQHNNGHTKTTTRLKGKGRWKFHLKARGFTINLARSVENKCKKTRKKKKGKNRLERKMSVIVPILQKHTDKIWIDSK